MRYTSLLTKRAVRAIRFACAVFFVIFSFLYLFHYQSGILALEQHYFSDGQTAYNPYPGTLIITGILLLLGIGLQKLIRFPIRFLCAAWFPSLFILGLLTSMHFQFSLLDLTSVHWGWILFSLVFLVVVYIFSLTHPDSYNENKTLSTYLASNTLFLSFFSLLVCQFGNNSTLQHYELEASILANSGQFEEVLKVGKKSRLSSEYLTALRCYALSHEDALGDKLFTYALPLGSHAMLPDIQDSLRVRNSALKIYSYLTAVPRDSYTRNHVAEFLEQISLRDSISLPNVIQYRLCSFLLDKDLDRFDSLSTLVYDTTCILPRHYLEARALSDRLNDRVDSLAMQDSIQIAFENFLSLQRDNRQSSEQYIANLCRERFGDTYWFYFFFVR